MAKDYKFMWAKIIHGSIKGGKHLETKEKMKMKQEFAPARNERMNQILVNEHLYDDQVNLDLIGYKQFRLLSMNKTKRMKMMRQNKGNNKSSKWIVQESF